jgi:hypothetical protein
MSPNDILDELHNRFGEWIEQAGTQKDQLVINILCKMLQQERDTKQYLEKRLDYECQTKNNSRHT